MGVGQARGCLHILAVVPESGFECIGGVADVDHFAFSTFDCVYDVLAGAV